MNTKTKRLLAMVLALVMALSILAGCSKKAEETTSSTSAAASTATSTPAAASTSSEATTETAKSDTLVVASGDFSQKFSAFFETTVYDQYIANNMNGLGLLASDREGNIVLKGIEGETRAYNGTDYTYTGLGDCDIVENDDGTVDYNITIRNDVKFEDGEPLTIDDAIFSMYVYCDPTYDGAATLFSCPIEGMEEYRAGMATLSSLLAAAGEKNTDFTLWTKEQQDAFWAAVNDGGVKYAQEIVDYCIANSYGTDVATSAAAWGYDGLAATATAKDFFLAIGDNYGWNFSSMEKETAGTALSDLIPADVYAYSTAGIKTGDSAASITGIKRTGDYSMTIHMTKVDATALYQLSFVVSPLHYYGDPAAYDYNNNKFGFTKGDLSTIKAKGTVPKGAGPYKFVSYENGTVTMEANENYFDGCPKIKYVLFKETSSADMLTGISTGTYDLTADASFNKDAVTTIKGYNSNGELDGDKYTVYTVDNLGYGYIGMNANLIKVGDQSGSDQSKALRKGLATLLAVYRDTVIDSYYGDLANVIQYPISNTSWAAPKPADDGYAIAFSKDVDGKDIYTADMTDEQKYDAALQAAIGFFKAAGYTWDDASKTFTAAPAGASMSYEVIIPADGSGDHPAYGILTNTKDALAKIGLTLQINDVSDGNILWDGLGAGTVEMWAAAWQATPDPDMYQIYYSENIPENGGTNHYHIQDSQLDKLIVDARSSVDQAYRKATYKDCLNIILDWAVEIPDYQRVNATLVSTERVNVSTMTPDVTTFWPWYSEIQKLEMN